MIVIDSTIVTVALPTIGEHFRASERSLVWIVNAYLIPYGAFMPLSGRVGDYFGHGRAYLIGIAVFLVGSLLCGLAPAIGVLIGARVAQGAGAAMILAASLPLMLQECESASARATAFAFQYSTNAIGGSAGLLLGGLITQALDWRWIFLINIPIGILVYVISPISNLRKFQTRPETAIDAGGITALTISLVLATMVILSLPGTNWSSPSTLLSLAGSFTLFALFVIIESRAKCPAVPLALFVQHTYAAGTIILVLWTASQVTWLFMSALYLQRVLQYEPFRVGLAFLPATLTMAIFSFRFSTRVGLRFGLRGATTVASLIIAGGIGILGRAPVNASFWVDVLPAMICLGLGFGIGGSPLLLGILSGVKQSHHGVASGIVSTSAVLGGTIALAAMESVASSRVTYIRAQGANPILALTSGYHFAFMVAMVLATLAAFLAMIAFRQIDMSRGALKR